MEELHGLASKADVALVVKKRGMVYGAFLVMGTQAQQLSPIAKET